jgi:tetratricopeptide (TPR) repeat protein
MNQSAYETIDANDRAGTIQSIEKLENELASANATGDTAARIAAFLQLGKGYLQAGNAPKSLTQFEDAITLAEANGLHEENARLWGYKGIALAQLGNMHLAQRALFHSLNAAKEIDHKALQSDALGHIGQMMAERGDVEKAIGRLDQALALAHEVPDLLRAMHLEGKLGALFLALESLDKAADSFAAAMHTAQRLNLPDSVLRYRIGLGSVMLANNEPDVAIEQFEIALNEADALESPGARVQALDALLQGHAAAKHVSMVQLYADTLLALCAEQNMPSVALASSLNTAAFFMEQEQPKRALKYLQRGLDLARNEDNWAWQAVMLEKMSLAYYMLEAWDAAADNCRTALDVALRLHDEAAQARLYGHLAATLAETGAVDDAKAASLAAIEIAERLEDFPLVGEQQVLLAFSAVDAGDMDSARDWCRAALKTFGTLGDTGMVERTSALLAEIEAAVAI